MVILLKFRLYSRWITVTFFLMVFFLSAIGFFDSLPEAKGSTTTQAVNAPKIGRITSNSSGCNLTVTGDSSSGSLSSVNITGSIPVAVKNVTLRLFEGVGWRDGRFNMSDWSPRAWGDLPPMFMGASSDGDTLKLTIRAKNESGCSWSCQRIPSPNLDPSFYRYVIVRVRGTSNSQFEVMLDRAAVRMWETQWMTSPVYYNVYAFDISRCNLTSLTYVMLGIRAINNETASVFYDFVMFSTSSSVKRYAGDGESVRVYVSGANFSKTIFWTHTNATYTISAYDGFGNEVGSVNYTVRRLRVRCVDVDGGGVSGATVRYFTSSMKTDSDGWTDGLIFQQTDVGVNVTWQGVLVKETFRYVLSGLDNVPVIRLGIYNLKVVIKDSLGIPAGGCSVSVILPNGTRVETMSDPDGVAVIRQFLPGRYEVTVSNLWQTVGVKGDTAQATTISVLVQVSILTVTIVSLSSGGILSIIIAWRTSKLPAIVSFIKHRYREAARMLTIFIENPSSFVQLLVVNFPLVFLLLMVVPFISLFTLPRAYSIVQVGNLAFAAFLFGVVGAFISVFQARVLPYFREEWKVYTPRALTLYWVRCSENRATPFVVGFMVFILAAMVFTVQGNSVVAEVVAVYAFYFLVLGVAFSFLDLLKGKAHLEE